MSISKVFIVTGASKGIGAAIVQHLLRQSHRVVLVARSQSLLDSVKASHPEQVAYLAGDVTEESLPNDLVDLAVKSFGRLDGIVINHSLLDPQRIETATLERFRRVYEVNLFSSVALAQACLQEVRKTKGCILWVSSGAATLALTSWSAYSSSKAALNSVSAHLAAEEPDIISTTIEPGRVNTDMQARIRSHGMSAMNQTQYDSFVDAFNQGDLLRPEQPADVIARFVANPSKELSGWSLSWDSPELSPYRT